MGVQGPPTCQVPLQRGRGALVPTVAAEEEEPDQESGQHQSQDPEEPGHSWVSDSPGCQDIHAEGRSRRASLSTQSDSQSVSAEELMNGLAGLCPLGAATVPAAAAAAATGRSQPEQRQPQMDTSCSRRSPAQTSAHVSLQCVGMCASSQCVSVAFY